MKYLPKGRVEEVAERQEEQCERIREIAEQEDNE